MNTSEELISKTKSVNKKQEQETDLKAEVLLESAITEKTSWWRRPSISGNILGKKIALPGLIRP
ncbi:hypothetical protein [Desulfosporosinus sp. BG]|uniref:hypothetical protein n=1 Tax=Desulfosporosinus sp. BG TaxID=1633135 RepID=UPI0008588E6F|nr:hypothetical protein [Desulfosporosinus sp. BG]ODA41922.1 hypothetical protein DSBG_1192 [Desulfosporosinus sp. BG]